MVYVCSCVCILPEIPIYSIILVSDKDIYENVETCAEPRRLEVAIQLW